MHKHTHDCCKHDCLHFCSCCNKAYCCKCGKEWGEPSYYGYYAPLAYPYITATDPCATTITCDDLTCGSDATVSSCVHSHN